MKKDRVLVLGACGQLGTELTMALRAQYGESNVIAADLKPSFQNSEKGPYIQLDVLNRAALHTAIVKHDITQVYLLAAMLSATGERNPLTAWELNMQGLLNILDIAREVKLHKIFWPSSIAVFGQGAPKINCPQTTIMDPSTVYGISKLAGEGWCNYYFMKYGVDVRSLRYPGLISHRTPPGGGTTDYAVDIFHQALDKGTYTCFLKADTALPMLYMPDAVRATLELMDARAANVKIRTSYNLAGISFTPAQLAAAIQNHIPDFSMSCVPDSRQLIADSWPDSIDDSNARNDWGWQHEYELSETTRDMLLHLAKVYPAKTGKPSALHTNMFF